VEAFMVRSHPRWHAAKHLVDSGRLGTLRTIAAHFSYARKGGDNIRSKVEWGGGALLDIGCYPVMMSRYLYGCEPLEVMATIDRDAEFGIDALASAILRFPTGTATFTCSGELALRQSMQLTGTKGYLDIPVPFNPSETLPTELVFDDGRDLAGGGAERIAFPVVNQFVAQADAFADAIEGRAGPPVTLEDSIANLAVLDALFRSGETGRWEPPLAQR
jgi:predicted dehydrogenase